MVCHSAKHALSHALLALLNPGDEVLLLAPVWGSYDEQVKFAGARPVHVAPSPGGQCVPDIAAIRAAVGPRTRGIMLNSPSNPSGYVWSEAELRALGEVVLEHDLWLISDEIYARLVFDGARHVSPASFSPELAARDRRGRREQGVRMTGYRIGFLAAAPPLAKAVASIQSQVSGCPNYVSQKAYEACLLEDPPEVASMIAAFDARRRLVAQGLADLGLTLPEPRGAFYAFPDLSSHFDDRGRLDSARTCSRPRPSRPCRATSSARPTTCASPTRSPRSGSPRRSRASAASSVRAEPADARQLPRE